MLLKISILSLYLTCLTPQRISATKISGADDERTGAWNLTNTDELRRALLPGYDRWVRPANSDEVTPVKFSLRARHIHIDEAKSTATLVGWTKILWHDNKLQWNASEYGGIDSIRVSPDEIWKPDLELYNPATKPASIGVQARVLLYADGTVLWVPPVRFDVFCELDMKSWPRDKHSCKFLIGSWTHHAMAVDLSFDESGYETDSLPWDEIGGRWKLGAVVTERLVQVYNCCAEPYISLQYEITVERRGSAYIFLNEVPVFALVILLVAAALRDPASRGVILAAVAIISSINLISLSIQLPSLTDRPPRIAIYYCGLLCLAAVWGVTSALADRLSKLIKRPIPGSLRRFMKKSKLNIVTDEDVVAPPGGSENALGMEAGGRGWRHLAAMLDAVCLAAGATGFALLFVFNL